MNVEASKKWKMIRPVVHSEKVVTFLHHAKQFFDLLVLRAELILLPEHELHHVAQHGPPQNSANLHVSIGAFLKGGCHLVGDVGAVRSGGIDLLRGEEVGGGDPAEGSPVGAMGGEPDGSVEQEAVG